MEGVRGGADILDEWDMIDQANKQRKLQDHTVCKVRLKMSCFMVHRAVEVESEDGGAPHHNSAREKARPS